MKSAVIQEWVQSLTFMQQSVLLTAIRGPDGLPKEHVSKLLIKWLRRCVLYSAFDSKEQGRPVAILDPFFLGGGGFTGPSCKEEDWQLVMLKILKEYLQETDCMPHHFQMHFMHAAEIVGYCHPNETIRCWWNKAYETIVRAMHVEPESYEAMTRRLGDSKKDWMASDVVNDCAFESVSLTELNKTTPLVETKQ